MNRIFGKRGALRMVGVLLKVLFLLGLTGFPSLAQSDSEPSHITEPELEQEVSRREPQLQLRGSVQASYSFNGNEPPTRTNDFRFYDSEDRRLKLDLVNLDLQYGQENPGHVGFRFDMTGGQTHSRKDAALGLFRNFNTGFSDTSFDFRQAYLSYNFESLEGMHLDVGKFATHIGYEVMDGVDGVNANASRAFAFGYGPLTHTGARLAVPVSEQVTVTALTVLGWDNFRDNNDGLSFGFQIAAEPTDDLSLALNYLDGPENDLDSTNRRRLWNFVADWRVHERLNLGADLLTGTDERATLSGSTGTWRSAAVYVQPKLTDWMNLNLRYELFEDDDGVRTGATQTLRGFTVSPSFQVKENLVLQMDFRWDESTRPLFTTGNGFRDSQMTTSLRAIYLFGN